MFHLVGLDSLCRSIAVRGRPLVLSSAISQRTSRRVRPHHGPAQVIWAVRTVTKGSFNQKLKRFLVNLGPWNDRDLDLRFQKVVDDAIGHVRIPTFVLLPLIDMRPQHDVRIQQPLFFIPMRCSELIVRNTWEVDDHDPGSPVHGTVVHAGVNLPIDVLPALRLSPDQYNSHRRVPEIPVSDLATNLLIGPLVRNVVRVNGSIHKYGVPLPRIGPALPCTVGPSGDDS